MRCIVRMDRLNVLGPAFFAARHSQRKLNFLSLGLEVRSAIHVTFPADLFKISYPKCNISGFETLPATLHGSKGVKEYFLLTCDLV